MGDAEKGGSIDPVKEQLNTAKRSLQEGKTKPAGEAIAAAALGISKGIEGGVSSKDPLAYTLKRVIRKDEIGSSGIIYLLEPPQEKKEHAGVDMVYVVREQTDMFCNISLLDSARKTNPYDRLANTNTRKFHLEPQDKKGEILDEIQQIYDDIQAHGIKKDSDDFTYISYSEGIGNENFQQFAASLPFTGQLSSSSPERIAKQEQEVQTGIDIKQAAMRVQREEEALQRVKESLYSPPHPHGAPVPTAGSSQDTHEREERIRKIREENELKAIQAEEERQKLREAEIARSMSYITGTATEIDDKVKPTDAIPIVYTPNVDLTDRTVGLPIYELYKDGQPAYAPVIVTIPADDQELQPEKIHIMPNGGDTVLGPQNQRFNLSNLRNSPFNQSLGDVDYFFSGLLKSNKKVGVGNGPLAQVRITVGEGKNKKQILFSEATEEQQRTALALLKQTSEKMATLHPDSPLTPAYSALAQNPERTNEIGSEARALQNDIIDVITGNKRPPTTEPKATNYLIDRANISFNDNTVEFMVYEPGRSEVDRNLRIRLPLTGKSFEPESISLGINELPITYLKDIQDPVLLKEVLGIVTGVVNGKIKDITSPHDISIRAGDTDFKLKDNVHINASQASKYKLLEMLGQQLAKYANSPFADILRQQMEKAGAPNPDVGPFEFMEPNLERLAGKVDEQGNIILGELLTPPLDYDLLTTIGMMGTEDGHEQPIGSWIVAQYTESIRQKETLTNKQKMEAISGMRKFLATHLLNLKKSAGSNELWLPNPDGFALQRGFTPVIRTHFDDSFRGRSRGGSLEVGQADIEGNVPLRVEKGFSNIEIEPTKPDDITDTVYEFEMEDGKIKTDGEGKPVKTKKTGRKFRPAFRMRITEDTSEGSESYTLQRVELGTEENSDQGILIQCSSADVPTLYTSKMVTNNLVSVTRKPIIYLYPAKPAQITVKLNYNGTLTNTYPQISGDTWNIHASPDGTVKAHGKKYKYLFWDGVNQEIKWDWSSGFCVQKDEIDKFLEEKTERLGLNFAEAQDFITYWAPVMKQNQWSLVSFQTKLYEDLAKLTIFPNPDTLIRVFMVFKKVDRKLDIQPQKLKRIKRIGFTVVEWGGSNLDELRQDLTKINHPFF